MQRVSKQLHFPLAGVAADIDYRRSTLPEENDAYATPMAINVMGEGVFEDRRRGGSRPCLALVSGVTDASTGKWLWPNGEQILWPNGDEMVYKTIGDNITLPDGSRVLYSHASIRVPETEGSPVNEDAAVNIATIYRDRLVAAVDTMWYASATGSFADFDYSKNAEVVTRAAVGNTSLAGRPAEDITALVPYDDKFLLIATKRTLRLLAGEPTTGNASVASDSIGIVSKDAWCRIGAAIYFLAANGLYAYIPGEAPVFLSGRLPRDLKGIDSAVLVADYERGGVHVLLASGTEWYYDISAKAFWQNEYPVAIAPVSGGHAMIDGVNKTVFYCADGAWRTWDEDAETDCGTAVTSSVIIGPFRCGRSDSTDGMLDEITATFSVESGEVEMFVHTAHSAEAAVVAAKSSATPSAEFTFFGGWNRNVRPRKRGSWACLTIAATEPWAFEAIQVISKPLGRLR